MWYVYILECSAGRFYTGVTDSIERRFLRHKTGQGGRFTKIFGAEKLLYHEKFSTRRDAVNREVQLKGWTKGKNWR